MYMYSTQDYTCTSCTSSVNVSTLYMYQSDVGVDSDLKPRVLFCRWRERREGEGGKGREGGGKGREGEGGGGGGRGKENGRQETEYMTLHTLTKYDTQLHVQKHCIYCVDTHFRWTRLGVE